MIGPTGKPNNRETIRRLTERLITGGMTSEEFEYFESILMEDVDARQTYIEHLQVHSHLSYLEKARSAIEDEPFSAQRSEPQRPATTFWLAAGLLAGCFITFGLFLTRGIWWQPVHSGVAVTENDNEVLRRSPVVGKGVIGLHPNGNRTEAFEQTAIRANQDLEYQSGMSQVWLQNGVMCVIEGPAKVRFRSPSEASLEYGRLIARVPDSAVGFRVDTPHGQVVDLGTTFGVSTFPEGRSYVQVFSGSVAVRSSYKGHQELPLLIRAGKAARLERDQAPAHVDQPSGPQQFAAGVMALDGILHVSGEIHYLSSPPTSVRAGQLQSDQTLYLFAERNDVTLPKPIRVISPEPKTITCATPVKEIELPAGTRCRSIMIHSDLDQEQGPLTGTVRFDRPVLGIIISAMGLQDSDAFAGSPLTEYPTDEDVIAPGNLSRGTAAPWKSSKEANDSITIHNDRLGVTATLQAPGLNIDQIRILLQAESDSSLMLD
mgnify:CR=1 FL=1